MGIRCLVKSWTIALVIISVGLILAPIPVNVRLWGVVLLTCFLPGWALVCVFPCQREDIFGRLVLAVGLSFAITILAALVLAYVQGSVTVLALVLTLGLASMVPLIILPCEVVPSRQSVRLLVYDLIAIGICVAIAAFLVVTNLGYADYWGDEMNGLLRALAVVGGQRDVLFEHTKGPAEVLIPAVFGLLAGRWDPFSLRLPFALAHITGVAALYLLARSMFNRGMALLAASLLALNGLYVAFGRIVQYQSIEFLLTTLTLWLTFHFYRHGGMWRLASAALLSSVGLLAHYDALVIVPVLAFLIWQRYAEQPAELHVQYRQLVFATLLAAGVVALFYYPYLHHPHVSDTAAYLRRRVIGVAEWPANNFDELYVFNVLYNSVYYVVVLGAAVLLKMGYDLVVTANGPTRYVRTLAVLVGIILASLATYATGAQTYLPLIVFCLWLVYVMSAPAIATELKAIYVWVGIASLGYVFFVDHPRTHLRMILPGAAILAALGITQAVNALRARLLPRMGRWFWSVPFALGTLLLALFANYQSMLFVDTRAEYVFTYPDHRSTFYWEDPAFPFGSRRPYGMPHRLGWQMIQQLFLAGTLQGDWDSNDHGTNLFWYTLGWPRNPCYPRYYFAAQFQQKRKEDTTTPPAFNLDHYVRIGQVWNRERLQIDVYEFAPLRNMAGKTTFWREPEVYSTFVTPGDFRTSPYTKPNPTIRTPLASPAVFHPAPEALQQIAVHYNDARITQVRDRVALLGYDLDVHWLRPGGALVITLYWQAMDAVSLPYKVFVHLVDVPAARTVVQADDLPACGTRPTARWRIGEIVPDRHVLVLPDDLAIGTYILRVGLYEPQTQQRLDLLDVAGNPQGTAIDVTTIEMTDDYPVDAEKSGKF
ncbi:MAG: glycosyltransferase family 39 protein [Anaerolineae bacterium]